MTFWISGRHSGGWAQRAVQDAVGDLCCRMICKPNPDPSTKPLLWWMVVLVQSAVDSSQQDDYISRGRFFWNILPMDLDIRNRIEAVQHYAKALVLNRAFHTREPRPRERLSEVQRDLNVLDNEWLNADTDQRPPESSDSRRCDSVAWKQMLKHLNVHATRNLAGQKNKVLAEARKLLA